MKHAASALLALALGGGAQAQALRDPFARPAAPPPATEEAAPETAQPAPQLRAIMYTRERSLANINGRILAVGEWFGDHQLTKIQERSVTLARRGTQRVLALDAAGRQ